MSDATIKKTYTRVLRQLGKPVTEQLRIRYHAYAIGYLANSPSIKTRFHSSSLLAITSILENIIDATD